MATAIPVGTRALAPGSRTRSSRLARSHPASPSWAYRGVGTPLSSLVNFTTRDSFPHTASRRVVRDLGRARDVAAPGVDHGLAVVHQHHGGRAQHTVEPVSYTHLRAHETPEHLVCRLLLE